MKLAKASVQKFFLFFVLVTASVCQSYAANKSVEATNRKKWVVTEDNEDWHAAAAAAKKNYPLFLKRLRSPEGASGFSVKVLLTADRKKEYIWLNPVHEEAGKVKGVINNVPEVLDKSLYGTEIEIQDPDIVDWLYQADGKTIGAFTTCANLTKLDPDSRNAYISKYGLQCEREQ